jgi:hypothetical protein
VLFVGRTRFTKTFANEQDGAEFGTMSLAWHY